MPSLLAGGTSPIFHLLAPARPTLGPFGIVTDATFHPVPLAILVVATVLYLRATARLRRAGQRWPSWRTASFLAAIAALAVATLSGLDAFERASFAIVGTQDALLVFVAPSLLAISAPITLAVASAQPGRAERIRAALSGRVARVATYPLVAAIVFGGSLCLFYFTPAFRVALDHRVLWQLIELELFLSGFLFAWTMAAVDPLPKPAGQGWRMLWLLLTLPYTTIVGMSLESEHRGIAPGVTTAELHAGGGILWTVGGLLSLVAAAAALVQWCGLEQRSADRRDQVLDPEAETQLAYWRANRRLAAEEAGLLPRSETAELVAAALGRSRGEPAALGAAGTEPVALGPSGTEPQAPGSASPEPTER